MADGTEAVGIDMYGRREKKVVLIIKHLFGLDIWPPCVCKRTKLIFVLYYALALGGSKKQRSNAYGVASAKILEISTLVLLSEIDSGQRNL